MTNPAGYKDLSDRILGNDERFQTDPQLRAVFRRTVRAWDAAAVYANERTYLGEVIGEHPTFLDVRLWRDGHSEEFPRIKDGDVRSFSKEQLGPIGATDIGTIIQYDEVEVRNFGQNRIRRVGKLIIPSDSNYAFGVIDDDRDDSVGIHVVPGGIAGQSQTPIHFIIYGNQRLDHIEPHNYAVVQINYDKSLKLSEAREIHRVHRGEINNIAKIGFLDTAWGELTDATLDALFKPKTL